MNDIITIVAIQGECNLFFKILCIDGSVFKNKVKSAAEAFVKIIRQGYRV